MGFGSLLRKGGNLLKAASKIPGVSALPLVGNVLGVAGGIAAGADLLRGRSGGSLPALPAGGLPMLTMANQAGGSPANVFATQAMSTGARGTMPPMTMDMIRQLEAAGLMIGFKNLRLAYRSPSKNLVVVHPRDPATGQVATFALEKKLARAWGLWSPPHKPPISVGKWRAIAKANSAIKTLKRMNKAAKAVANFGSSKRAANTVPFGKKRRAA